MRRMVLAGAFLVSLAFVQPALAADLPTYKAPPPVVWFPTWFVEARAGASFGWFEDLSFHNPVGAARLGIPGSFIPLNDRTLTDTSATAGIAVGRFITNNVFVKASYQYFGRLRAHGFADFTRLGFGEVRQDLTTTNASALLFGLGTDFELGGDVFAEAIGELGVGFLRSTGRQGENVGLPNFFPAANNSNFVAGAGVGVGYHATRNVDVMVNGNYYWLGKADSGLSTASPTQNAGEQLQAKLSVFTATVAARARF